VETYVDKNNFYRHIEQLLSLASFIKQQKKRMCFAI
jgi:hypothetical protein